MHPVIHRTVDFMMNVTEQLLFTAVLLVLLSSYAHASRDSLIQDYFRQGYPYKLILCFLHFVHGISLSLRQLKQILRRLGLKRRPPAMNRRRERQLEAAIRVRINKVRRYFTLSYCRGWGLRLAKLLCQQKSVAPLAVCIG